MGGFVRVAAVGRCLALVAAVGAAACQESSTTPSIDFTKQEGEGEPGRWVHSGYYDRTYDLRLPDGATTGGSFPLLIVLHGAGDTGRAFRARIAADARTDDAGFVTVYPDALEGSWAVGCACTAADLVGVNDVVFLNTLVRQLATTYPVDTTRVFVAGFSQGAQLAQRYGCESARPPAGIAAVAGLTPRALAEGCDPAASFPVIAVHGDADPIMRYHGFGQGANILSADEMLELWAGVSGCAGEPDEDTLPDDNGDGTTVTVLTYEACAGARVRLDRVNGGGHTWPGATGPWPKSTGKLSRNLDATAEILSFFAAGGS